TARADGGARPAPRWAADFHLAAVVNTSMFGDDLRSIGLLRDARAVNSDRDNPKLGGFLAFDPVDPRAPPAVITGRGCPGFDLGALRREYRGLVQNYRLLGCAGEAIRWADPKIYSSAAVGLDRDGRIVFLHARVPMQMTALARALADLDLAGALYVEGGPEASLVAGPVAEVGSFETGFFDHSNRQFWDIPNVLGAAPR
ncbi:MAG TPA: phosphodiester glycosidase family protein, partial [Kofleriaceae bacterium]|nr:phosphodiester glycosidase family protein [Kofleriaceae bacterium]